MAVPEAERELSARCTVVDVANLEGDPLSHAGFGCGGADWEPSDPKVGSSIQLIQATLRATQTHHRRKGRALYAVTRAFECKEEE